jgi:polyisoprenoid-binding protein YceI
VRASRSPYWAALVPPLALIGGGARWLAQGSGNVYTATSRRYYVPDPDLGWRLVSEGPLWLGLEMLALIAALGAAVAFAAWLIRRRERGLGRTWVPARLALWVTAALPLALPIAAFATGLGPGDARDRLPLAAGEQARVAPAGISGALAGAPAGRYRVVPHEGSAITARVQAGGETFDTRFAGNVRGHAEFDPAHLSDRARPLEARIRVDAASVDTGITTRSKHAREYLKVEEFPEIGFELNKLLAAQQGTTADEIEFWARGRLAMMGRDHEVIVIGSLRVPDLAARQRLGVDGDILLVSADLAIALAETALAGDAGDFDNSEIPIHVSLVLAREAASKSNP